MIELLKKLCAPIGVSGNEQAVRAVIENEIKPYCDKIYTDRAGNLFAEKKGKKEPNGKIMIAAHMDEVGFIITSVTESGLLRFSSVGGIDPRGFIGKRVAICGKNGLVSGVIGAVAPHLLSKESAYKVLKDDELYINVGAQSKSEALALVSLGDTGVLSGDFSVLKSGKILARALDDRAGCAVLTKLLQSECEYSFTAVFTVQEEIGCRGAQIAASALKPDFAIVLDSTTACDLNDIPDDKTVCRHGEGGVVSFMDRGCAYDRELFSLIMKTAEENNIPAQVKRAVAGANDSASIHKTAGGVKTAAISLPCRYLHTPNCLIDKADLDSVCSLVSAVLPRIAKL
ncbi:MAG: M42 family metallopeptidase [Oscillospiraceae bacterium]|nr:M42 family metallopeptidase [Oscillospiraceae bacterium]